MQKIYLLFIAVSLSIISCNTGDKHADHDATLGNDGANDGTACKMKLAWDKQQPSSGDSVHFTFTPLWQPSNIVADLETLHEKKIHFIIVNEDLSYFDHLHLDQDSAGSYKIATSFPDGGKYLLIADYKAKKIAQQADTFNIVVSGKTKTPVTYNAEQLTTTVNGYSVQLIHQKLLAGHPAMLFMKLSKGDTQILPETLQTFLGERAHMIAINTSTKEYEHIHAKSDPMSYWFMTTFSKTGFYKLWIQFKMNDVVNTAALVVKVE